MYEGVGGVAGSPEPQKTSQNEAINKNLNNMLKSMEKPSIFGQSWHIGDSTGGKILPEGETVQDEQSGLDKMFNQIKGNVGCDEFGNPIIKQEWNF